MPQAKINLGARADGIASLAPYDHQEPFAEGFMAADTDTPYLRFAKAFSASWLKSEPRIGATELVVGIPRPVRVIHHDRAAGIMLSQWRYEELMQNGCSPEEKNGLKAIHNYFKDGHITSDLIQQEKESSGLSIASSIGRGPNYQGHILLDYAKALRLGVDGLKQEIQERQSRGNARRSGFYEGLLLLCDTITAVAESYANEAEGLARDAESSKRADELREIAAVCKRVAHEPAQSFHEALQLHWFVFLIDGNDNPGRVDQLFGSCYDDDLRSGRIDRQTAKLMLSDMGLKMDQIKAWGLGLGGVDEGGEDASNELTRDFPFDVAFPAILP